MRSKVRCPSADTSPKFINLWSILGHARSMADSLPWPFPSGKPCHQFVGCGCRAGPRMPTYSRRHSQRAVGWLRSPVRSIEPSILTSSSLLGNPRRVKRRDRKVARVASRCMGSSTGMVRVAAVVDTTSDSPRWCRPTTPAAAFDVKKGSVWRQ